MKLHISFNTTNLHLALSKAQQVAEYADALEIGPLLLLNNGINAVEQFRTTFPQKTLLVDTKIVDHGKEIIALLAPLEIDWISLMAGTASTMIHATCSAASANKTKVMLDLLDSGSLAQSALEAKSLGADAIKFQQPYDLQDSFAFLDKWEMIKGNSSLPVFISAKITRENISAIADLKPHGIVVGSAIIEAVNPAEEARYFYEVCNQQ